MIYLKKYLEQKEVFVKKEISNVDLKTIIKSHSTIFIKSVECDEIRGGCFSLDVNFIDFSGENKNIIIYQYLSKNEFLSFVKENFIPIKQFIESVEDAVKYSREELERLPNHNNKEEIENYLKSQNR